MFGFRGRLAINRSILVHWRFIRTSKSLPRGTWPKYPKLGLRKWAFVKFRKTQWPYYNFNVSNWSIPGKKLPLSQSNTFAQSYSLCNSILSRLIGILIARIISLDSCLQRKRKKLRETAFKCFEVLIHVVYILLHILYAIRVYFYNNFYSKIVFKLQSIQSKREVI